MPERKVIDLMKALVDSLKAPSPNLGVPMFEPSTAELSPLPAGAVRIVPHLTDERHLVVANRQRLKQEILDEWEKGALAVHVDFAACGYIDSSAIGALLSALNHGRRDYDVRCRIVLERVSEDLRNLFEMIKIAPLFEFQP